MVWTSAWALVRVQCDGDDGENFGPEEYVSRCSLRLIDDNCRINHVEKGMEVEVDLFLRLQFKKLNYNFKKQVNLVDGNGISCWSPAAVIEVWEDEYAHVRMIGLGSRYERIATVRFFVGLSSENLLCK